MSAIMYMDPHSVTPVTQVWFLLRDLCQSFNQLIKTKLYSAIRRERIRVVDGSWKGIWPSLLECSTESASLHVGTFELSNLE